MSWRHEDVAEFITRLCHPALAGPGLKIKRLSNRKLPFSFSASRVCNPLTSGLWNSYDHQSSTCEAFRPLPSCFPFLFFTRISRNRRSPDLSIPSRFALSFFPFPFVSYSQPKLFFRLSEHYGLFAEDLTKPRTITDPWQGRRPFAHRVTKFQVYLIKLGFFLWWIKICCCWMKLFIK